MAFKISFVIALAYLCFVQTVKPVTATEKAVQTQTNNTGDGFGYEILLSKMDYLEYKFLELEFEIKEQNEQIMRNQEQLEQTHSGMTWMLTRMEQALGHNFTMMMNQSWEILQQQKSCANHENLRKEIFSLKPIKNQPYQVKSLMDLKQSQNKGSFESCKAEPSKVSGKYLLKPFGGEEQFVGYCEQNKYGGGWLVIHHRFDGSVDFLRNWTEYKRGFGEPDKECWIGLELLHKLTKGKTYHLMVELEDYNGTYSYAKFEGFEIGSEAEKYSLKTLGTCSGTAGDSLKYHKGMKFSTVDSDNDIDSSNCAKEKSGAWWFTNCHHSNLNGIYLTENTSKSVSWYTIKNDYHRLKYTRMMIREA